MKIELRSKEKEKKRKKQKKEQKAKLSFADDEDEFGGEEAEEDVPARKAGKFATVGKNPDVSTHFLPDGDREVAEAKERELLKEKYIAEQERIKNEKLEITFSYWDGGGHRRKVEILKGDTIAQFLGKARDKLSNEFRGAETLVD